MKRLLSVALVGSAAAVLFGCPIYAEERDYRVCTDGTCYSCPDPYLTSACSPWGCGSSFDCPGGYVCESRSRTCRVQGDAGPRAPDTRCAKPEDCPSGFTCSATNVCVRGDCATAGCPTGYACKLSGGSLRCVGGPSRDGGTGPDCTRDAECSAAGAGAKCLNGECITAENQCSDATQCPGANVQCVDGACTPACDANTPCPIGYACDRAKGVCTANPTPCGSGQTCGGGAVCVGDRCVAPCSNDGACPAGLVCVAGGCIPNQKPQFVCQTDGQQDSCNTGSICLRRNCYIACDPTADVAQCRTADRFNQCKSVSTANGTFAVCGSATNLGTECDPAQNKLCPSTKICIDGFCR
jgi:hypothetical protein